MTSVVELYEALTSAEDDRARAKVIAEAFERLEDRYPHLPELVTQGHLRETELRLQKEIEQVRLEIGEVLTRENLRIIRPGYGIAPKHYESLLGRPVNRDLPMGTAIAWEYL